MNETTQEIPDPLTPIYRGCSVASVLGVSHHLQPVVVALSLLYVHSSFLVFKLPSVFITLLCIPFYMNEITRGIFFSELENFSPKTCWLFSQSGYHFSVKSDIFIS